MESQTNTKAVGADSFINLKTLDFVVCVFSVLVRNWKNMASRFVSEMDAARNMERRIASIPNTTTTMVSPPTVTREETIGSRRMHDPTLQHVCKRRRENSRSGWINGDFDTTPEVRHHQCMSSTVDDLMRKQRTAVTSDEVDDSHLGADYLTDLNDVNFVDGDEDDGKTMQTMRRPVIAEAVRRVTNPRSMLVHNNSKRDCSCGLSTTTTPTHVINDDTFKKDGEQGICDHRRERYRLELLLDDLSCLLSTAVTLRQTRFNVAAVSP
jgi:hypothetical protein